MPIAFFSRRALRAAVATTLFSITFTISPALLRAATVHGTVTDASGASVTGAAISLLSNGAIVATGASRPDGTFQLTSGSAGRFFLVVSANNFRQLQTPDFYAGALDAVERDVVLEPAWVRESIVVTATGVPTPQPQTSEATTVLSPLDLSLQTNLVEGLRTVPGAFVEQSGQRGSATTLFLRGGNPDANKVMLDGIDAGDLGGQFDFGQLSTTGIESAEIYRGPNSNLYGANAASGVINLTTPHGTTSFPSILTEDEAGNFHTSRELLQISGARNQLDYLAAASWFQTSNALPNDEYHLGTGAANVGWSPSSTTQLRGTVHYGIDATGIPNAWDFFHVADNATQRDQDLYISGSIDNQTTSFFHNDVRYGSTRKREQSHLWSVSGTPVNFTSYCFGPGTLGKTVTITGANGYSATGQAVLDCSPYQYQIVSNRDQLVYQGDFTFTPHFNALIGFQFEDQRGTETFYKPVERTNYDYIAAIHGDFKNRLFYTLGGSLEHYSLFGVQTSPRGGVSFYIRRPHDGAFSSTRILANFGDAVREPKLTEQDGSLYAFLQSNGGQSTIQQLHISRLAAPTTRTYEGGIEQSFFSSHIIFRASYFHNQYGRELEGVGLDLIPELLPNLTSAQQQQLENFLQQNFAFELTVNSEAYRAQGAEASIESGIGRNLFLRGGYTYLDAVVQRSFTNDDLALLGPIPTFHGIPVGPYSPLQGARPFRRPPHTGFFTATYAAKSFTALFNSSFASRSDDSTFLENQDASGGNSLLLPNRNLDFGFADLGIGGSYQLLSWLTLQAQADNLLSSRHIAPIGYPSLPMNFRAGVRVDWGLRHAH